MSKTNYIGILTAVFACYSCQRNYQSREEKRELLPPIASELIIDIDPFYNWGRYPKVRLVGPEALQVKEIVEGSREKELEPIPSGMTISPAPGLSVIRIGKEAYHIMPDCAIVGRQLSLSERRKLFAVLSKHTNQFSKPET